MSQHSSIVTIWIEDKHDVYTVAEVVQSSTSLTAHDIFIYKIPNRIPVKILKNGITTSVLRDRVYYLDPSHTEDSCDMACLENLNPASVLHILRQRYLARRIYTRVFPIIISIGAYHINTNIQTINTYKSLSYENQRGHVYHMMDEALDGVTTNSQSIILCGESGSGKSSVCYNLIEYLCHQSLLTDPANIDIPTLLHDPDSCTLEAKILSGGFILDMFGNCKTSLNRSATRYIKYLRAYVQDKRIMYAEISHFLLERSRVTSHSYGESSFHVFYALLASITKGINSVDLLGLDPTQQYQYIRQLDGPKNPGHLNSLLADYNNLVDCMHKFGISGDVLSNLFQVLSAIILLGNVEFVQKDVGLSASDASADSAECMLSPSSVETVEILCKLLGIRNLEQILTSKAIQGGRSSVYFVGMTVDQAESNKDSFAKALYCKLFCWVVNKVNEGMRFSGPADASYGEDMFNVRLRSNSTASYGYVGILDMYGFEMYEKSRFEQFCINYCNEKIQHVFYSEVFSPQVTLMVNEECPHKIYKGLNNRECLTLLEGDDGILRLIDEHCLLSRANQDDQSLLVLFSNHHGKKEKFGCSLVGKKPVKGDTVFKIRHFAYSVPYSVKGFMRKNLDRCELDSFIRTSVNSFVQELNTVIDEGNEDVTSSSLSRGKRIKKAKSTVCSIYRNRLAVLVNEVNTTSTQFVQCIKPNKSESSSNFDSEFVMHQLQYCGVFDIIKVYDEGYSIRLTWKELHEALLELDLFDCKARGMKVKATLAESIENIKALFNRNLDPTMWFVGASGLVYMKACVYDELHRKRNYNAAAIIQKNFKVHSLNIYREKLCRALHRVRWSVYRYILRVRRIKTSSYRHRAIKEKSYLLMRWRLKARLRLHKYQKILKFILFKPIWKSRIRLLIRSQRILSQFLKSRLQRLRYRKVRHLAVVLQKHARGMHTRRFMLHQIEIVKAKMHQVLCRKAAHRIYSAYRNFVLRNWVEKAFTAIRWDDVLGLQHLLGQTLQGVTLKPAQVCLRCDQVINVRDASSGYTSLLHMAVDIENIDMVELLLQCGASPYCHDFMGHTPLNSIPLPPTTLVHALLLSLIISHCKDALDYPDANGYVFDNFDDYIMNPTFSAVPCENSTLGKVLADHRRFRNRMQAKARHKEAMYKGTTIVTLFDPNDWEKTLPECCPVPESPHMDMQTLSQLDILLQQAQQCSDESDVEPADPTPEEIKEREARDKIRKKLFTSTMGSDTAVENIVPPRRRKTRLGKSIFRRQVEEESTLNEENVSDDETTESNVVFVSYEGGATYIPFSAFEAFVSREGGATYIPFSSFSSAPPVIREAKYDGHNADSCDHSVKDDDTNISPVSDNAESISSFESSAEKFEIPHFSDGIDKSHLHKFFFNQSMSPKSTVGTSFSELDRRRTASAPEVYITPARRQAAKALKKSPSPGNAASKPSMMDLLATYRENASKPDCGPDVPPMPSNQSSAAGDLKPVIHKTTHPEKKWSVEEDVQYRMLIAKKNTLEKDPVLHFMTYSRLASNNSSRSSPKKAAYVNKKK